MGAGTTDRATSAFAPQATPDRPRHVTVAGHNLTVYVEFPPLLEDILRDLRQAQRRIWIEVYIFAADAAGRAVAEILKQKAQQGVEVRILYDAIGSQSTPTAFFNELAAAGVQVHCYHSLTEALYRLRLFSIMNRRNHRKLVVIDDRVGYFGGMNIIDNTAAAKGQTSALPTSAGWRDVHLRLEGPQQPDLAESFDRSWTRAHGEKITRRPRAYRRAMLAKGEETIRFFDSGPGMKFSRASRVFTRLLRHAKNNVVLSMAYFIPVGRVLRALLAARRRGVRLRVIIPGKSDVKLVQRATTFLYTKLLRRGFRLYERKNRMLHSKVMVVDGTWTVVGSCNFDPRSLWINLEFLAVIRSKALASLMAQICRFEMEQSQRITLAACQRVGRVQRFLNSVAWMMRWWL